MLLLFVCFLCFKKLYTNGVQNRNSDEDLWLFYFIFVYNGLTQSDYSRVRQLFPVTSVVTFVQTNPLLPSWTLQIQRVYTVALSKVLAWSHSPHIWQLKLVTDQKQSVFCPYHKSYKSESHGTACATVLIVESFIGRMLTWNMFKMTVKNIYIFFLFFTDMLLNWSLVF